VVDHGEDLQALRGHMPVRRETVSVTGLGLTLVVILSQSCRPSPSPLYFLFAHWTADDLFKYQANS
jgi:hypothetical protein